MDKKMMLPQWLYSVYVMTMQISDVKSKHQANHNTYDILW